MLILFHTVLIVKKYNPENKETIKLTTSALYLFTTPINIMENITKRIYIPKTKQLFNIIAALYAKIEFPHNFNIIANQNP